MDVVNILGNVQVAGTFYGVTKVFDHNKTDEWLGVAVDVSPGNDKFAVNETLYSTTLFSHKGLH